MRTLSKSKRFLQDLKHMKQLGKRLDDMDYILELLLENDMPPAEFSPHKLRGKWKGYWECHIEEDWLLIYKMDTTTLYLTRTGTHQELFGE